MQQADAEGVLYNQLELETEIQKRIREKIHKMNSFWKQVEVNWFTQPCKHFKFCYVKNMKSKMVLRKQPIVFTD